MEAKAKEYAKSRRGGDCKYKVTMYLNGKLVEFCVDSGDGDVDQVYSEYDQTVGGGSLSDYFTPPDNQGEEGGEGDNLSDIIYFPTPTYTLSPTPIPTGTSQGGPETNYPLVNAGCEAWSSAIVRSRAIISNTYCTVLPTPTP